MVTLVESMLQSANRLITAFDFFGLSVFLMIKSIRSGHESKRPQEQQTGLDQRRPKYSEADLSQRQYHGGEISQRILINIQSKIYCEDLHMLREEEF